MPAALWLVQAQCSRRVVPDPGGGQECAQEAPRAYRRGDYGCSMCAAGSAEERACALNNFGCIQARPLAGRPATVEVFRVQGIFSAGERARALDYMGWVTRAHWRAGRPL